MRFIISRAGRHPSCSHAGWKDGKRFALLMQTGQTYQTHSRSYHCRGTLCGRRMPPRSIQSSGGRKNSIRWNVDPGRAAGCAPRADRNLFSVWTFAVFGAPNSLWPRFCPFGAAWIRKEFRINWKTMFSCLFYRILRCSWIRIEQCAKLFH